MELLEHYLSLAVKSIFIENILLAYFLGMCSFLAISKKIEASIGLGLAVIFVSGITVPLNWIIRHYILSDGALSWIGIQALDVIDLAFLSNIAYIAIIAATVQLVEMLLDKYSPSLYNSLGIFLPLIAVNCAILGASIVFGVCSDTGFAIAIVTMAAIRFKLRYSNIPNGLRGLGITMILTGLISMAYLSFSGINL